MTTKIDCSKADTAEMMVELRKRGYTTVEKGKYQEMVDAPRRIAELEALLTAVCTIENARRA